MIRFAICQRTIRRIAQFERAMRELRASTKKPVRTRHRLRRYMSFVRGQSAKFIPACGQRGPRTRKRQCRRMDASPDAEARARNGSSLKR
jgi:hypothetical protein